MFKIIVLPLIVLVFACSALAQKVSLSDTLSQELVITHSKYPTSIKHSYKPMTIIDSELIERQVMDDLGLLLDQQVGVTVNGSFSNPGKDKSLYLQGASGAFTLILVDGVPVTDPSGIGGSFDLRSFSLSQIERIEIVKGGQSALYGSDAIAGVINLITKDSQVSNISADLRAAYGSYNSNKLTAGLNLSSKVLNFNFDASHAGSNGISEALDVDNIGFDKDHYNRNALNSGLTWHLNDKLKVKAHSRFSRFEGDFDGGAYTDASDHYTTEWLNTGLASSYEMDRATLNLCYSFNKTDRIFDSETFGLSEFRGRFHNIDLFGNSAITEALNLTFGFNYQVLKMMDPMAVVRDPEVKVVSPYAALQLNTSPKFNAEIGFRLNDHNAFGLNSNISLGASYWLATGIKVFSYYATSFKAPNLFQLYGQFGANAELEPQTGKTLNLGLSFNELRLFDHLNFELFARKVDQLIVYSFPEGYSNLPAQDDKGLELSLTKSSHNWSFQCSYEFLFGELINPISQTKTENLIRRPKHQLNGRIGYSFSDFLDMSLMIRHTGSRKDLFFDNATFMTEEVILDAYLLASLQFDYSVSEHLRFYSKIDNLFNADFQEIAGFATMGRNIHFGLYLKI